MEVNQSVFNEFPVLKTKRLTLRPLTLNDADAIYKMRASGRVNEFIPRPALSELEQSKELVEKTIQAYNKRTGIAWAGILRDKGDIIGTCGFNQFDFQNLRAEIGGELNVDYWGKKIPLELVSAIVKFGFDTMNLHTIEAKVSPNNRGAIYLL
ncbi:GNAT family N-acetyltransferase [Crocinitomix sp.]|nr:GNAT family N-acetyltransferase [Crocinitomix sp.]